MRVRARIAVIVAGLLAGVYLVALFSVRRVPDRVVAWLGGPTGIARDGGLAVRYKPPDGFDTTRFDQSLARRGAQIRHEGDWIALELVGIDAAAAGEVAAILRNGALEFREVFEDMSLFKFGENGKDRETYVAPGVRVMLDVWRHDDGDGRYQSSYLLADRPEQLDDAFDQLSSAGWRPPPHSMIAYEEFRPEPGDERRHTEWRSHFIGEQILLDGNAVANAVASHDPNTYQPTVLLEFDPDGRQRFGDITSRVLGHKLAALIGGVVKSAPVINTPIRGGRAVITMGGGDLEAQEREAQALAAVLVAGAFPAGGLVERNTWIAPAAIDTTLWLARLMIGLVGGALVGLVFGLVVRVARPSWQPPLRRRAGRLPIRRIAVTMLAPVAVFALGQIEVPGINTAEIGHLAARAGRGGQVGLALGALGVGPILAAFFVVELATTIVPRWRRTRLQPGARIRSGRYVALLGIAFALLQGHIAHGFFSSLLVLSEAAAPGWQSHITVMLSMTAGTLLLVIVAGMIRQHGLGNGYAAVILSGWAWALLQRVLLEPTAGDALGALTLVVIGVATVALLRMRIGDDREAPLRLPSSGLAPVTTARVAALLWALVALGLIVAGSREASTGLVAAWLVIASTAVFSVLWSLLFSRPAIMAPIAARSRFAPPSQASWRRATLLSAAGLTAIVAASLASIATTIDALPWCDALSAMLFAAVALDALDDLRARRGDLVTAWPLHQPQHAELVRRVLADAGIECHLVASHLRTLLAWFGPFAPIDVVVPAASVDDARHKIAALYEEVAIEAFD
jgi:preprotein translocase subunit SecY